MKLTYNLALIASIALFAGAAYASHGNSSNGNNGNGNGGSASSDKVTICHYPPGNPANAHTLTIGISAWPAHQTNHGDTMGVCSNGVGNGNTCYLCQYQVADFNAGGCALTCGLLQK